MSAIDELKNANVELEATGDDVIDISSGKIELSSLSTKDKKVNTIRSVVDTREIAQPEAETKEEKHISPIDDMLNPDNPNSMLSKYAKDKEEEAREWIAEKQEEQAILDSEDDDNVDSDNNFTPINWDTDDIDVDEDDNGVEPPIDESLYVDELEIEEYKIEEDITTDIEDIEDQSTAVADLENEDVLKYLQKLAIEKLKPVSRSLDISSFTVLKKPITNVTPLFKETNARVIKWVLPSQESIVAMKEFSGAELEKLREYSENSGSLDSLQRRFKIIYDHIVSPKPASLEQWLKTTPYDDIDHYFFAVYAASFKGANYLPADCENDSCKNSFLTDEIDIMDMVKFATTESKEMFDKLYHMEDMPAGKGVYCTEVVPMNEKIAVSFRKPSVYNVFEVAAIDNKTRDTFSYIIDYIPYIDTIYAIDIENQTLTPITYKIFPDSPTRTIKSKIQKYSSILSILSVDEFAPIKSYIGSIVKKSTGISYVYPEIECPKCHSIIKERGATAEQLVFTRYQLGALVSTSLN